MRIILLGPPGVGKGTQAELLSNRKSITHISTGNIMRAAMGEGTELGLQVKSYVDSGDLVPDSLVIELMRARLSDDDCRAGFLLDGFPRTIEQAKALKVLLSELGTPLTGCIELTADDSVLVERILKRGRDSGRSDDTAEVITKRLEVYHKLTAPLSEYYQVEGILKRVDGIGTIEEVYQRVVDNL